MTDAETPSSGDDVGEHADDGEGVDGTRPRSPVPIVVAACVFEERQEEAGTPPRARYLHGVERIAAAYDAVDPVVWREDRAWLSFGKGAPEERVQRAWHAAVELWKRGYLDLGLPIRIAVFFGFAPSGSGGDDGARIRALDPLLGRAPERVVIASEQVALSLRPADRETLRVVPGDGAVEPAYVFPGDAVRPSVEAEPSDLEMWGAFEEYAKSPDVRDVHYVGFRLPRRVPPVLDLLEVFVAPSAMVVEDLAGQASGAPGVLAGMVPAWGLPIQSMLAKHRHLVVLGEPGAGKSTLLRWLAIVAAEGQWPALTGEEGPRLPLLLSVGRLAEKLSASESEELPALLIPRYFDVEEERSAAAMARFLERQLEQGRCAVLLDGLDEVRAEDRGRIEGWLSAFGARYPRNVFVATSRSVGYSGLRIPGDAAVAVLASFGVDAREQFVRGFCRAYLKWETREERPAEAEAQSTALLEAIAANDRLAALAQNPFMLSALALIHRAEGRLPRHRVQAYEMFLRAVCETWAEARKLVPGDATRGAPTLAYEEQAIPVLGALALAMHERYPRGVAPVDFVRTSIADALRSREDIDEAAAIGAANAFLERAGQEVQVLLERGPGQWGFSHLTFQEFFVAAGLHATERFEEVITKHLLEPRWEEIVRLGVGYLALVQKRPIAAQRFIERVLTHEASEPWAGAVKILGKQIALAALLAVEAGEALPPRAQRHVAETFAEWFCEGPLQDLAESAFGPEHQYRVDAWLRQMALSDFATPLSEAFVGRLRAGTSLGKLRAAMALTELGAQAPSAAIVSALEGDSRLGSWAFSSLFERSASDEERRALMKHPDERIRTLVVQSLVDAPRAERAAILAMAASDSSVPVRWAAAFAMEGTARIGGAWRGHETPSPEEESRLLALLDDPSDRVRSHAFTRLGESTRENVRAAMERLAHEDPSVDVRRGALVRWARYGGSAAFDAALKVFSTHAGDPAWKFHRGLLVGWVDPVLVIPRLLSAARSPDAGLRATAGFFLSSLWKKVPSEHVSERSAIEAVVPELARDSEPLVRRETLSGLDVSAGWAFDVATAATADPDSSVRLAAYEAIGQRGASPTLANGIDDEDPAVRASCLGATLHRLEEPSRRLVAAVADPSELVRQAAARWLNLAGEQIEALLRDLLADPSPDVRRLAAETIANHRLHVTAGILAPSLHDPDAGVRRATARALAFAGDDGMRVLMDHAERPEARAALWMWADQREWAFPPPAVPAA